MLNMDNVGIFILEFFHQESRWNGKYRYRNGSYRDFGGGRGFELACSFCTIRNHENEVEVQEH